MELLVVVTMLAALATLLVASVQPTLDEASESTTRATLAACREAILGRAPPGMPVQGGYLADQLALPPTVADLLRKPTGAEEFDPARGVGWRGPYVRAPNRPYQWDLAQGFTAAYGQPEDPGISDAWGGAIVLQYPDKDDDGVITEEDRRHARLVSAGADGILQTPFTDANAPGGDAHFPPLVLCGDDEVLYVLAVDTRQ